jgi:hypothetical protein
MEAKGSRPLLQKLAMERYCEPGILSPQCARHIYFRPIFRLFCHLFPGISSNVFPLDFQQKQGRNFHVKSVSPANI